MCRQLRQRRSINRRAASGGGCFSFLFSRFSFFLFLSPFLLSLESSVDGPVGLPRVARHLLSLLRGRGQELGGRILLEFFLGEPLVQGVRVQVVLHPLAQLLHVRDRVQEAALVQEVRVLIQGRRRDDPAAVVARLEVRVLEGRRRRGKVSKCQSGSRAGTQAGEWMRK